MKRTTTLLAVAMLTATLAFAQASQNKLATAAKSTNTPPVGVPQKISYQASVRDTNGTLLVNQSVGIQLSILMGSTTGTSVYVETHTATTNANGLVTLAIGSGNTSDDFSAIVWESATYFIETAIDPTGGSNYSIESTSQMLSVPYALYAQTSGSSIPGPQGVNGKSAYEIYAENHTDPDLSESEWLASLKGDTGSVTALAEGNILIGNESNEPTAKTLSGDATLAADGSLTISNNAVTSAKITDDELVNADLKAGTGGIYKGSGSLTENTTVTGAANTLAFTSTATNGFSVDGTTFSVDAANHRVGIGTITPAAELQVIGENRANSFTNEGPLGSNPSNSRNHFTQYNAGAAVFQNGWIAAVFGKTDGNRVVIGQAEGKAILGAHPGNLDAWSDLAINPYGGNVGINTDNPIRPLTISGGAFNYGEMSFVGTSTAQAYINLSDESGNAPSIPTLVIRGLNNNGDAQSSANLNVIGNILVNGVIINTSDKRLKTNIHEVEKGIELIKKLTPVSYDKKSILDGEEYNTKEIGFIAQEVKEILPILVSEDNTEDKILSLNYNGIIPVLTKAIQEQQDQIEAQKQENEALKTKLEALEARLLALEKK